METVPSVTKAGALWASVPLLAAAQLWSWHPLWAAGIWTVYGLGALVPQGEAWLKPLTESPLYTRRYLLHPVQGGAERGSFIYEQISLNTSSSRFVVPERTSSSFPESISNLVTSTTSNLTSISSRHNSTREFHKDEISETLAASMRIGKDYSSASSFTNDLDIISIPRSSKAVPVTAGWSLVPDQQKCSLAANVRQAASESKSSGTSFNELSSTSASVTAASATPNLPSCDRTTVANGVTLPSANRHDTIGDDSSSRDQSPWKHEIDIFLRCSPKEKVKFLLPWLFCAAMVGIPVWAWWVWLVRPVLIYADENGYSQYARSKLNSVLHSLPHNQLLSTVVSTPANMCRAIWRMTTLSFRVAYVLLFETQVGGAEEDDPVVVAVRQWLANLIWGGQTPHARVCRALAFFFLSLALVSYPCWLLASIVLNSFAPLVEDLTMRLSLTAFSSGSSRNFSRSTATATNSTYMVFACLTQLRDCTVAAYRNPLYPDSTYYPTPTLLYRTGTVCNWIEFLIMHFKNMPRLYSLSSAKALTNCFATAWANQLSLDGWFTMAHQNGLTAPLCISNESLVMQTRINARSVVANFAIFGPILDALRPSMGCVPFMSMLSGSRCPAWAHMVNHTLCVVLFTTMFALNVLTIVSWPAPQLRWVNAKIAIVLPCLSGFSVAVLRWFLDLSSSSIPDEWVTIVSTFALVLAYRALLVSRWVEILRWLRIAPWRDS